MERKGFTAQTGHQHVEKSRGSAGPEREDGSGVQADRSDGANVLPVAQSVGRTTARSGQAVAGIREEECASEEVAGGFFPPRQPEFERGTFGNGGLLAFTWEGYDRGATGSCVEALVVSSGMVTLSAYSLLLRRGVKGWSWRAKRASGVGANAKRLQRWCEGQGIQAANPVRFGFALK
jgi:hypothetical protein